jgi:hypothetical protein
MKDNVKIVGNLFLGIQENSAVQSVESNIPETLSKNDFQYRANNCLYRIRKLGQRTIIELLEHTGEFTSKQIVVKKKHSVKKPKNVSAGLNLGL